MVLRLSIVAPIAVTSLHRVPRAPLAASALKLTAWPSGCIALSDTMLWRHLKLKLLAKRLAVIMTRMNRKGVAGARW